MSGPSDCEVQAERSSVRRAKADRPDLISRPVVLKGKLVLPNHVIETSANIHAGSGSAAPSRAQRHAPVQTPMSRTLIFTTTSQKPTLKKQCHKSGDIHAFESVTEYGTLTTRH